MDLDRAGDDTPAAPDTDPLEPAFPLASAHADGIAATADPMPSATAKAPTRPTYRETPLSPCDVMFIAAVLQRVIGILFGQRNSHGGPIRPKPKHDRAKIVDRTLVFYGTPTEVFFANKPTLIQNRPGLSAWPALVELPGIDPALEIDLNWENADRDDVGVRQNTRKHLGERESC